MSLREKTLTGVKWNLLATIINTFLGLVLLWCLSHLLTTTQFGIVSSALIISAFCSILLDFGISNSIVRSSTISNMELSSLSVINVVTGLLICALVFSLSGLISNMFRGGEALSKQVEIISFGFVLLSLGLQPRALLTREMKFNSLAKITILTTLTNFLVAVTLATIYRSAWCIAVAFLVSSAVNVLASRFLARDLITYKISFQANSIKKHLNYGLQLFSDSLVNQLSINVYPVLMSRLISMTAIGGYNIAYNISISLFEKLNPVLSHALFPAFAKISHDEAHLKRTLLKVTTFSALVNFPMLVGMSLIAKPLVSEFFDVKWDFIIPVVQVMCVIGAIRSIDPPVISVLLVKAKMYLNVRLGLVKLIIGIPLTFMMGRYFGLLGIIYSFLIIQTFNTVSGYFFLVKPTLGKVGKDYLLAILIPLLHVIPLIVFVSILTSLLRELNYIQILSASVAAGILVYAITIFISPFEIIKEFRKTVLATLLKRK